MKNLSKLLLLLLFISHCSLLTQDAQAIGTLAGTNILNTPAAVTLNFRDENNNAPVTRNSSNSVTTSIQAVYGLTTILINQNLNAQASVSTNPDFLFTVTNNSNIAVTINANSGNFFYTGSFGTGGWSKAFADNRAENISNDSAYLFSFEVKPTANALNGATGSTTVNFYLDYSIPLARKGAYQGFNSINYGGATTLSVLTTTTVAGPDLQIVTRSMQFIAPALYNGPASNLVPGGKLVYTIVIKNFGTAAAVTANITKTLESLSNVDYFYNSGTTVGFGSHYGTPNPSSVAYSNNGGSTYVYSPSGSNIDSNVNAIRWTYNSISAGATVTLNYAVIVK